MASAVLAPVAAAEAKPLEPAWAADLDHILAIDRVPGAAISVITPEGVFEHLYGVASRASGRPITRATGFQLCSLSKAYTATLALLLERDGVLRLDDPVAPVVPELAFEPAWMTGEVSLRDLLSNRLGVQRGGLADFGLASNFGYEDVARRLGHMRRTGPFRATFSYCNPAFSVAVLALERVTGQGLATLFQERLFGPAGLVETSLGAVARGDPDRARAHTINRRDQVVEVDESDDWVRPGGGGLMSTAADQQRWLRLNLGRGRIDGQDILPPELWTQLWQAHVPMRNGQREFFFGDPDAPIAAYGLGWFLSLYKGRSLVVHSGGGVGWRTRSALLPNEGIAVSILLNVDGKTSAVIQNELLDRCLNLGPGNWLDVIHADRAVRSEKALARIEEEFPTSAEPRWAAAQINGRYRNPESGDALIEAHGSQTFLRFEDGPTWDGVLQPLGGAVFEHQVTGPMGTYDGPRAPSPRVRFTSGSHEAAAFDHSSMGEFVRC